MLHLSCGTNFHIPFWSLISLVHLSAPLCHQAPTLNLLSTCLMVCPILGSRPISFPNLFLLSPPSPMDWLLGKWIGMSLVVFGVVNLVKCPAYASSASFWVHYNISAYLLTYLSIDQRNTAASLLLRQVPATNLQISLSLSLSPYKIEHSNFTQTLGRRSTTKFVRRMSPKWAWSWSRDKNFHFTPHSYFWNR